METEPKKWPEYHNDEDVFMEKVAPLVDQLHTLCEELGLPLLVAVSFMNSEETRGQQTAYMFNGPRTPDMFLLVGKILKPNS